MGEELGKAYVEENFPPTTKAQTVAMIRSIEEAYEENLRTLDWMSEETRQQALIKLRGMVNKVGYPDRWRVGLPCVATPPAMRAGGALSSGGGSTRSASRSSVANGA